MAFEFPVKADNTPDDFQYMLGDSLLVASLVETDTNLKKVYLPKGQWYEVNLNLIILF
jgi:alpha-glucosidase (family GH31 glycosyl hydrolase)